MVCQVVTAGAKGWQPIRKFCEIDNQFHIDTVMSRSYNNLP